MDHRPKDSSSANVCGSIVLALSLDKRSVCITEGQVRPSMFYINGRTPLQYLYLLCSLANFNLQKERERESQETAGIDACHDRSHGRRIHINLVTCNLSTMRYHQPSFAKDRHQECLLFPWNGEHPSVDRFSFLLLVFWKVFLYPIVSMCVIQEQCKQQSSTVLHLCTALLSRRSQETHTCHLLLFRKAPNSQNSTKSAGYSARCEGRRTILKSADISQSGRPAWLPECRL